MPRTRISKNVPKEDTSQKDSPKASDGLLGNLFFTEEAYSRIQSQPAAQPVTRPLPQVAPVQVPAPIPISFPTPTAASIKTMFSTGSGAKAELIRIPPFAYLHVTDSNSNVTRVVEGPRTFFVQDQENVVFGPVEMVRLPPRHFCIVSNPVVRNPRTHEVMSDASGQVKLRHGDQEVRLDRDYPDPFPLYPGEELTPRTMIPLQVVPANTALRLRATRDFTDRAVEGRELKRSAGEEWLFEGHATYFPQVEVEIVDTVRAIVLKPNQALRLRARNPCTDRQGRDRKAGEEWLVILEGAYLPGVEEVVVGGILEATVLTEHIALHLRALRNFVDVKGVERKTGDEWLVTKAVSETHIPDVHEFVVGIEQIVTLTNRQFCVVEDPVDEETKRPLLGQRRLVRGPRNFFLQPGERLDAGAVRENFILGQEEALMLTCREQFEEDFRGAHVVRRPGDRWLWYGPGEFVPRLEVDVLQRKRALLSIEGWRINWFFWATTRRYLAA